MLKNKFLNFLKDFSTVPSDINSLLVSSYIHFNDLVFKENILIKDYIISEDDDNFPKLQEFINLFKDEKQTLTLEDLILLFEFVISPSDKIVNGAVYTPKYIREFIIKNAIDNRVNLNLSTVCDVACGCGGFLYEYASKINALTNKNFIGIIEDNLFGIDVTDYSIERTKILLTLLALSNGEDQKEINFNLFVGDSLEFDWYKNSKRIENNGGFDFIFSNPPYVGSSNLDEKTKELMKNWYVASTGKLDLYIPFFEIGLKWLTNNGVLGYITVNNFYRSLNGRALRSYFSSNLFDFKLIDFGSEQVFQSRLTYTCLCQITKTEGSLNYTNSTPQRINQLKKSDFINFEYEELDDFDGWQLDDAKTQLNISRLENSGSKLIELFDIRNGFATLRNNIYLFKPYKEDIDYYYFLKDDIEFKIEKDICRDAIKPNILKEEKDIDSFREKLIFPYKTIQLTNSDLFQQNSRQIFKVIPMDIFENDFPLAYKYLSNYKDELAKRDKGKRSYETWYAFGRSQALQIQGLKLLFPYISDKPYFVFTDEEDLLFYNGYALVSNSKEDLKFIQKILKTDVFWYYIERTSKPYLNNYFALAKNYIKNFTIPDFTDSEKKYFMKLKRKSTINKFLIQKYNLTDIDF